DLLARGCIGPSVASALTLLPREDQDRVLEAVQMHCLKAADAVLLAQAYRIADETDRRQLLRDPAGALHPKSSPVLTPRAAELEGRLQHFRQVLADLRTFFLPLDLAPAERRRLEAIYRTLIQDLVATAQALAAVQQE